MSRIDYLMPANNSIVLDLYFNFTNKSNVIDMLSLAYNFFYLVVAYFLGHPVCSVTNSAQGTKVVSCTTQQNRR